VSRTSAWVISVKEFTELHPSTTNTHRHSAVKKPYQILTTTATKLPTTTTTHVYYSQLHTFTKFMYTGTSCQKIPVYFKVLYLLQFLKQERNKDMMITCIYPTIMLH